MPEHPKLFISYSHDSEAHKAWVLKLATDLRQHMGVDVILDQWDLRIGGDLSLYMEQGLTEAALVLCICSDQYISKANKGVGGSGYEKMIMTRALISNTDINYIIPVIRNNTLPEKEKLPLFLGTKQYIDFTEDKDYLEHISELTARIYNEDIAKKPPLGENPFLHADFVDTKNAVEAAKYHSPVKSGTVSFDFSNNSKRFMIGAGEYAFMTEWSDCGSNSIYAYRDAVKQIGYIPGFTTFPSTDELKEFDYTSRSRTVYVGEVVIWVNSYSHFAATRIIEVCVRSRGAKEDKLTFEYKIYC